MIVSHWTSTLLSKLSPSEQLMSTMVSSSIQGDTEASSSSLIDK